MSNQIAGLTAKSLRRAAALKERIDSLTKELDRLLGGPAAGAAPPAKAARKRRRGRMSKAARAQQAERMRKRWAKAKAAGKSSL